jgi:hypothetical protein
MKSPFFPLISVLGTIAVCTFFLWFGGTLAAAAAETGLDTPKIESITGLKGVLNEKENTFKVSKPRNDVPITVEAGPHGSLHGVYLMGGLHPRNEGRGHGDGRHGSF